jgi:hypothetical protein
VTLNRLSANRLSAYRLAANRLAANGVQTGEGAASDIVAIELPNGNRATR